MHFLIFSYKEDFQLLAVSGEDYYVYLVTNKEEVEVLKQLHKFNQTLPDIGLKMKTGLTVIEFISVELTCVEPFKIR